MRIIQTVFGVFHHFALAHELRRRHHLERVYSTWPWARLQREGLPHSLVRTFPWMHAPEYFAHKTGLGGPWLADQLGYANALLFDHYTSHQLAKQPAPDALIAISGSSLRTGRELQARGTIFFCDRGSTHQRYQQELLQEEYRHWKVDLPVSDSRDTAREEAIYDQADAIVVPSSFAAGSFAAMGVSADKVHVVPYGVDLSAFFRMATPSAESFDVLFAGSVGLRKGFPYLLQAFAALKHPRKRLRVAGSLQADLKPLLAALPLEHVTFLGAVTQPALRDLMSRSHVMVLPSLEEGLAMVQAQAMACECPVLCTSNTGADDLFTPGTSDGLGQRHEGFIVPIRDVASLRDRLQLLADDPYLQRQMGAAAVARVQQLGGWSDYGARWEQLVNSYLKPPPTK